MQCAVVWSGERTVVGLLKRKLFCGDFGGFGDYTSKCLIEPCRSHRRICGYFGEAAILVCLSCCLHWAAFCGLPHA